MLQMACSSPATKQEFPLKERVHHLHLSRQLITVLFMQNSVHTKKNCIDMHLIDNSTSTESTASTHTSNQRDVFIVHNNAQWARAPAPSWKGRIKINSPFFFVVVFIVANLKLVARRCTRKTGELFICYVCAQARARTILHLWTEIFIYFFILQLRDATGVVLCDRWWRCCEKCTPPMNLNK